jgi:hypothetical protein
LNAVTAITLLATIIVFVAISAFVVTLEVPVAHQVPIKPILNSFALQ